MRRDKNKSRSARTPRSTTHALAIVRIRRRGSVTKPCPACGEEEARLLPRSVDEYAARLRNGALSGTTIPVRWRADDDAFRQYLDKASNHDEEAALSALQQVLIGSPQRLWHPYVLSQFSHLLLHGRHPDLPRAFRDRVNEALVYLIHAFANGLGYWVTVKRSSSLRRGQTPSLFPRMYEQEGLYPTPESIRHAMAASDFNTLWDGLTVRLKKISWRSRCNEYRAVARAGKEMVVAELVEELKPILQDFWDSHQETGQHRLTYCRLAGDFPSDDILNKIAQNALAVPIGRNPRDKIGYEFLGRLKFNIGGWKEECAAMSATPSLIKSTLRTLQNSPLFSKYPRRK